MPEGLKLVVGADVTQAEKNLKKFADNAAKQGNRAGTAMSAGLNKGTSVIEKIPQKAKPAILAVSKLGDSIETLRAKLLAKQSFLVTEKDITKVAILNTEIKALQKEILRVQAVGAGGVNLGGVGKGATKALSGLRTASNVIPGIGIGGLVGLGVDAISSLFTSADKANEKIKELIVSVSSISGEASAGTSGEIAKVNALAAAVTDLNKPYKERNRALNELKSINKNYFGDLTLEASSLAKLTGLVDEYTKALIQQAVIKQFSEEISKVSVAIAKQVPLIGQASAELKKLEREQKRVESSAPKFSGLAAQANTDELNKAVGAVDKANSKLREEGNILNQLAGQSRDLRKALSDAVLESLKFKPLDDPSGGGKSSVDKTIETAKRLAAFLDKNTQFSVTFEVDPLDSENESIKKAQEFIDRAKNFIEKGVPEFRFKPIVRTEFNFIRDGKFLQDIKDQAEVIGTRTFKEVKKDFEDSILKAGKENPIMVKFVAQVNADIRQQELQAQQIFSGLGLKMDTGVLTEVQKQSVAAANTITDVLTPAFQDLFTSIKAGEDPLKSFFQGIGRAVEQLIQKLIAAAVQALVLSVIFPGGLTTAGGASVKGFGGFFKNILGFAKGGIISGPTLALVGEGINTSRSNPEVIAPLDQLRGMIADIGGGSMQPVVLRTSIRGDNITLIQSRTNRRNRRLGA
jgi:hypothetical protein